VKTSAAASGTTLIRCGGIGYAAAISCLLNAESVTIASAASAPRR